MKRLSKLLALVLTGVMALTLLAGCAGGTALSADEIQKNLIDLAKTTGSGTVEADATNYAQKAANAVKVYYNGLGADDKANFNAEDLINETNPPASQDPANIHDAVVPADSASSFQLYCIAAENYKTPYFQKHANNLIANELVRNGAFSNLNVLVTSKKMDTAAISVQIETIGSKTYVFMILRQYVSSAS